MSAKIIPAIVVGLLLGTTAIASAQAGPPPYGYGPPAYPNVYWMEPYAGTPFHNVAPYSSHAQPDPYFGTVWDGVAPY